MKILIIMDPGILIPVTGYGGHERLVEMFAKEYQRLGHEVHLLITSGSKVDNCIVHDFGIEGFPPKKMNALKAVTVAWKFLRKHRNDFDLIHNFGRLIYLLPIMRNPVKKIMTYGREISSKNIKLFGALRGKNIVFTACSANLLSRVKQAGRWEVVYNAIDFSKYTLTEGLPADAPLMFLGRIEKVKGCHTAIKVAKLTGNSLIIAGNISPLEEERIYFEKEIKPHIDGIQIQYVGALNDKQKNEYLGKAKALLFPIEWNEPFGIVMIEAMACGTPVIGFNTGSVHEVIDEGITGMVVADLRQMTESIKSLRQIDRRQCREKALSRFDVIRIGKRYLSLFDKENRIVIISTGQPSANPRVVKEAGALSKHGYEVIVIYCPMSSWANDFDKQLFLDAPEIKWINAGYTIEKDFWKYNFSRLRRKFYELLNRYAPSLSTTKMTGIFLFAPELRSKAISFSANIYIAHYLGALPAAIEASKKHNGAVVFDAEDFHRGEHPSSSEQKNYVIETEDRLLPKVNLIITASPLIGEAYKKLYPGQEVLTINNVFSRANLQIKNEANGQLKLFWFSQNIGPNRGLENIVEAMNLLDGDVSLHLLGNILDPDYFQKLMNRSEHPERIHVMKAVAPKQIFEIAARFDIGIAAEVPYDENRNICLTNKIFTYLLAGNCVLASDTDAQKKFMDQYPGIGLLYKYDNANDLASKIEILNNSRALLKTYKSNALKLAENEINWEIESEKLVKKIKLVLKENSDYLK
jgi:glycosyltransferase involved in cell wall biosynthesis